MLFALPSRRVWFLLLLGVVAGFPATTPCRADAIDVSGGSILLDFNGLGRNANNSAVQSYIQNQLQAGGYSGTVRVFGANEGNGYDGEGYVVGPLTADCVVIPHTLGNTDAGVYHGNANDRFLVNMGSDRITMEFSEAIYAISFDFEIFPNGSVPDGRGMAPTRYPDFTLRAFNGNQLVIDDQHFSLLPGVGGTFARSPNSNDRDRDEFAPQLLGSLSYSFPNGVTRLEFVDWPERIGIDNLTLQTSGASEPMPEPSSLWLMAAVLGSLGATTWLRRRNSVVQPQA